jgi:uncharacterized membrane protein YcaP (DUF421 family)
MFQPSTSLLEIAVRVVLIYAGLFLLLRLVGKKELGELAPMDFLTMLILSETVSPALTKQDTSLAAAGVAAGTLILLTAAIDWAAYRWKRFGTVVEGKPVDLVVDGKVVEKAQKKEKLSDDEIAAALRRQGVEDLSEVKRAVVENTGKVSVIKRKK